MTFCPNFLIEKKRELEGHLYIYLFVLLIQMKEPFFFFTYASNVNRDTYKYTCV